MIKLDDIRFQFGLFELTDEDMGGHTLALGSTGSGKSLILRILMQSVLPLIGQGHGYRALVYDAKQDALPIVSKYCEPDVIRTMNPLDERGYSWDLARDCDASVAAMQLSHTLIPKVPSSTPFFEGAARHIGWGVMSSFTLSELDWSFADLLRSFRNLDVCKRILLRHPETSHIVDYYFSGREKLLADIQATLGQTLKEYEAIAASWEEPHRRGKRVSLLRSMSSEQLIILGNVEDCRESIDKINRCIFKTWTDLILSQEDRTSKRFWTFVDELSEAGPLPSIVPLLKKCRSKGGRVVIAAQSIPGLQDSNLYGEHVTKDMLSCVSNRFVGRLECAYTAEYQSMYVGDQEIEQISTSTSSTAQGKTETTSRNRVVQRTVLPSEFMSVPPCGMEHGLVGQFKVRSLPACWDTIDPVTLFNRLLLPYAEGVPHLIPRSIKSQYLLPWTLEQLKSYAPEIIEAKTPIDVIADFNP